MRLVLAIVFLALGIVCKAQTTNYKVYALYVVNIAKYSSWPAAHGELKIGVLGKSKVLEELQKQEGKVVNGQTLKVSQFEDIKEAEDVHIIYVSDNRSSSLEDVMKRTEGKPVMVVAEREGLYKKGAGFSFVVMDNNTLKFDVNSTELEKRQIKVSKSLTALANSQM